MKARSLVPWLILTLPAPVFSQMVAGKAVDIANRRPLAGISVILRNVATDSSLRATTDSSGLFNFFPARGRYVLEFALHGETLLHPDTLAVLAETEYQRLFVLDFPVTIDLALYGTPDVPVRALSTLRPRYPDALRQRGVEGTVLAQFVVDTMGRPDMQTFRILRSPHPTFDHEVREVMTAAEFRPARKGGRKVRQLVRWPFVFCLGGVGSSRRYGTPAGIAFPDAACEAQRR